MSPTTRLVPACRFSVRPLALAAPVITLAVVLAAASAPGPAPAQQRVVPMRTGTQDKPVVRDEPIRASPNQADQAQTVDSITADIDPKHGGHDHGGPGQRPNAQGQAFTAPRADLAFARGLRLGSRAIRWGQTARIPAAAAVSRSGGYCVFHYAYATRNQGAAPSVGTANCIHRDTEAGELLGITPLAALNVGNAVNTTGTLQLKPGTWMLYVRADFPQSVTESDEANNLRRVRVVVKGDCG